MQKVYLLRNHLKTGPFTPAELWQQSIQPGDMVWIDGRSTAWMPISSLELSLPVEKFASPLPENAPDLESKANAIRQRAMEVPPRVFTRTPSSLVNEPVPAADDEDAILLIDHREQKNNVLGEVLMTLFIIALIGGGLIGGRRLFHSPASSNTPAITRITSGDEHAAARPKAIVTTVTSPTPQPDTQAVAIAVPPPVVVRKQTVKQLSSTNLATVNKPLNPIQTR